MLRQPFQGLIEGQQISGDFGCSQLRGLQFLPEPVAAMFIASLSPCILDQNSPHRLRRGAEKVATAVPVLSPFGIHESNIRLVNQRGGLKSLARLLVGQLLHRQFSQFIVQQR